MDTGKAPRVALKKGRFSNRGLLLIACLFVLNELGQTSLREDISPNSGAPLSGL